MTATAGARVRLVVLATAVLVALTAASRSEAGLLLSEVTAATRPTFATERTEFAAAPDRSSISSVPARVLPASDRPVVAGGGRRAEGQHGPAFAATTSRDPAASVRLVRVVPVHGSTASVGPVALGLTRRGPPDPGIR